MHMGPTWCCWMGLVWGLACLLRSAYPPLPLYPLWTCLIALYAYRYCFLGMSAMRYILRYKLCFRALP